MPWSIDLDVQELYLVSTMSNISVVRIDNGTSTCVDIPQSTYWDKLKITNKFNTNIFIKLMTFGEIYSHPSINADLWEIIE